MLTKIRKREVVLHLTLEEYGYMKNIMCLVEAQYRSFRKDVKRKHEKLYYTGVLNLIKDFFIGFFGE